MKRKHFIMSGFSAVALLMGGAYFLGSFNSEPQLGKLADQALLALIKNDHVAFKNFIAAGGKMDLDLPIIDGKVYTVSEGLSYFERPVFVRMLQEKKIQFISQSDGKDFDILSLSVSKNNPELLDLYLLEKPDLTKTYGAAKWTLLHLASALCSHKIVSILHEKGKLNWDIKSENGETPLTLAAQNDCLPVLSYWKEHKADFRAKDGRGNTALSILKKKKDAALMAFAESFETRVPAAIATPKVELNFYKKRKIPKDQLVDHTALIGPEDRPIEAVETAEFSEFSD